MRITKELARTIIEETKNEGRGLLDGGIAVCEYVSRNWREELTIAQGQRLHDLIEKERALMEKKNVKP